MERRTELLRWGAGALLVPLLTGCNCPAVGTGKYEARIVPQARYCSDGSDVSPEEQTGELEISNFDPERCRSGFRFSPAIVLAEASSSVPVVQDYPYMDDEFTLVAAFGDQKSIGLSEGLAGGLWFNNRYSDVESAFEAQLTDCGDRALGEETFSLKLEAADPEATHKCYVSYEVCLKKK